MKKIILMFGVIILSVGCNANETTEDINDESEKAMYMTMKQDEAYELMQNSDVIIIDVRTSDEYNQGHIENSNLLPVDVIASEVEAKFPDKSSVYLVYCRSGNRSKTAAKAMVELGYTQVYDIGGINTWQYEIVND